MYKAASRPRNICRKHVLSTMFRQKSELFLKFVSDNCVGDIVIDKFLCSIRSGKNLTKFINIFSDNELTRPDRSNSVDKHLVNASYFIYLFGFCSVLPHPPIRSAYFYFILLLFLLLYIILY
jgi:hypothetical protein